MKYIIPAICGMFSLLTIQGTSNWGTKSTKNNSLENPNFYGTLLTHQGQRYTVDHILVEGKHDTIPFYEAPQEDTKKLFNSKTKHTEIKLKNNPVTEFVKTKADLRNIKSIKVPDPATVWIYQKEDTHPKQEFLLICVTSKDNDAPEERYLMESKTRISCNSIDSEDSQKKEVPLAAIDTLTIDGYMLTMTHNKKGNNTKVSSPRRFVKKETETTTEMVVQ